MSTSSHARRRGRVTFPAPRGAAATVFTAFALAGCVGAGLAAQAFATSPQQALPVETETLVLPVSDLANPTGHQIRGEDVYGAGAFGASRGGGARRHRGADYVSEPGELVRAPISGVVQRIGYAYRGDARYNMSSWAAQTKRAPRACSMSARSSNWAPWCALATQSDGRRTSPSAIRAASPITCMWN